MKRLIIVLLCLIFITVFVSCSNETAQTLSETDMTEISSASVDPTAASTKIISTLDYKNNGKMGDTDGPAFAVYSKTGYNGASVDINLADTEIETVLPDGRFVNGYCFLGIDVYEEGYWCNCIDAGLCWSGTDGGWHVFYNIYETLNESTAFWYESGKKLPKNGTYQMVLTVTEDNYATLTVKSLTGAFKDSVKIEVKGAKADGTNTAFLFNTAIDYPPDTKVDSNGNPSEDWAEITLANSDKGIYLKKLHVTNLSLSKNGETEQWTDSKTSALSIWPDKNVQGFDYSPTVVYLYDGSEYYINLDMNR